WVAGERKWREVLAVPLERLEARFPKQSAAELFLWQMGERLAAPLHHLPLRNQWRMPGALPQ
ncbi:MAG: hypothetical protein Q3X05_02815, partial [Bilophila sp.]|nr:hypothetical protein [Bilophila sp.]